MHQIEPESEPIATDNDSLYLYVNNNIEYGLFEDIVDSYYLHSQIKDDFQCDHDCCLQHKDPTIDSHSNTFTHDYHHITQSIQDLSDSTQQNNLHSIEENVSSFTDDADTLCDFSIVDHNSDTENTKDIQMHFGPKHPGIHSQRIHAYRNTFGDSHIQYHDFDNQDSLTFRDKYTALLQQELQNPYWNLHDPIMTKSYQISKDMDIEMMPYAMYFTGDLDTIIKFNHIPYQTIEYNDSGMFTPELMNDTPIEIFIDNGATPSILPLCTYVVPPQSWGDRSDTKHSKCLLLGGRRLNQLTLIPKPKGSGGARAAMAQVGPANKRNDTKRCLPVEVSLRPGEAVPW